LLQVFTFLPDYSTEKKTVTDMDASLAVRNTNFVKSALSFILLLSIGLFGYLLPAIGNFTMIPGDLGDARFNSVILEHGFQWLTGQAAHLWSPSFFYPFERVLGLSDNHFGSLWSYSLLRSLGLPREMAYLGWYMFGFLLNFLACAWVLRQAKFSPLASALGAFVFTFALPVLHQEGHAQLVYRFAIPLACFCWYQALVLRDKVSVAQAIFWCAIQFMCSIYLGVFLVYCLTAMLLACWLLRLFGQSRHSDKDPLVVVGITNSEILTQKSAGPSPRMWLWYAAALGGIVLVFLLLRQYKMIATDYQLTRPIDDLRSLIPGLQSYLLADNSGLTRWVGSWLAYFPTRSEHQLFLGLGVLFFSVWGAWITHLGRVFLVTLLLLVGLTTMVADLSLYLWLLKIPGFDAIRAVSRIILVMLFPVAVLVAIGVDRLLQLTLPWGMMPRGLLAVAIVASLTIETVYYVPHHAAVQTWQDRQRGLRSLIRDELPKDTILFVTQRQTEPFYITELDAMIYAQDHRLATLNGYSGSTPRGYAYPDPCLLSDVRLQGYFSFRGVPEAKQKELLNRLRVVALEACAKQ
jgi:hypothetical protein